MKAKPGQVHKPYNHVMRGFAFKVLSLTVKLLSVEVATYIIDSRVVPRRDLQSGIRCRLCDFSTALVRQWQVVVSNWKFLPFNGSVVPNLDYVTATLCQPMDAISNKRKSSLEIGLWSVKLVRKYLLSRSNSGLSDRDSYPSLFGRTGWIVVHVVICSTEIWCPL
jgi:hypothetical protein